MSTYTSEEDGARRRAYQRQYYRAHKKELQKKARDRMNGGEYAEPGRRGLRRLIRKLKHPIPKEAYSARDLTQVNTRVFCQRVEQILRGEMGYVATNWSETGDV